MHGNVSRRTVRGPAAVEPLEGRRLFASVAAAFLTEDEPSGAAVFDAAPLSTPAGSSESPAVLFGHVPHLNGHTYAGTYTINGVTNSFTLAVTAQTGSHFSGTVVVTLRRGPLTIPVSGKTNRHGLVRFHGFTRTDGVRVHATLDQTKTLINGSVTAIAGANSRSGTVSLTRSA